MSIGECIESGLKTARIQGTSKSQNIESESLSDSQKEENDDIIAVWEIPQDPYHTSFSPHGQYPTN